MIRRTSMRKILAILIIGILSLGQLNAFADAPPVNDPTSTPAATEVPTITPDITAEPSSSIEPNATSSNAPQVTATPSPSVTTESTPTDTPTPTPTPLVIPDCFGAPHPDDWGLLATNIQAAHDAGFTGKGVKVAIIDSGIGPHDDVKVSGGYNFYNQNNDLTDKYGHGTHVAGIVAGKKYGVAPDAEIYSLRVIHDDGSLDAMDGFNIADAINWAVDHDIDIINLSLSITPMNGVQRAIERAEKEGVLVVAAAGNVYLTDELGPLYPDYIMYPARLGNVVSVGAVDSNLNHFCMSQVGHALKVVAPGVNIKNAISNTDKFTDGKAYTNMSGTSMAAPYVSGILALMKQAYPNLPPIRLRHMLYENAKDIGEPGFEFQFGHGLAQWKAPISLTGDVNITEIRGSQYLLLMKDHVTPDYTRSWFGTPIVAEQYLEKDGVPIVGQEVTLKIIKPNGKVMLAKTKTDLNGVAIIRMTAQYEGSIEGKYKFQFVDSDEVFEQTYYKLKY